MQRKKKKGRIGKSRREAKIMMVVVKENMKLIIMVILGKRRKNRKDIQGGNGKRSGRRGRVTSRKEWN